MQHNKADSRDAMEKFNEDLKLQHDWNSIKWESLSQHKQGTRTKDEVLGFGLDTKAIRLIIIDL